MYSEKFEQVKYYYDNGLWSVHRVEKAVVKNWITQEECNLILSGKE